MTCSRNFVLFGIELPPLKTRILEILTTAGKIMLIGYLILDEIKFRNFENDHFEKKDLKS